MAQYEHDAARRRKARLAKKARQARKRKQTILTVVLVAALLAVAALIFFLLPGGSDPGETTPQTDTPSQTQVQQQPQATEPKQQTGQNTITISVSGDLNVTDYVLENAAHENGYDFSETFLDVAPILSGADYTILNFEGNLSGTTYGTATGAAPLELPKMLKSLGVDAVQTANSAAIRQGVSGLIDTLDAFDRTGLLPLGTFASTSDFRKSGGYEIVEVDGIRIGLIAFTKGMDNLGLPAGSEDCVNLLYTDYATDYKQVDTDGIDKVLRNLAEEQPDITIALLHWGSEYNDEISDTQEKIRKQLQSGGVDIIVGSHPHVVQRLDYDPIAHTLVAYSLGDFFGDAVMGGTNYSVMLELQITKDYATGEVYLSGYDYTPIFTLKPEQSALGGHRVVRIREAMEQYNAEFVGRVTDDAYASMEKALERIENRLFPDKEEDQ